MASQNKRPRPSNDNESSQFNFSLKFLVIKSEEAKPITSLSPFIIEKQIESLIGTPKSVKKNLNMNSYSLRYQKQVKLTLYSKLKSFST